VSETKMAIHGETNKALVPVEMGEKGLQFNSLESAYRFAQYVVKGGLAPGGDTPEAVVVKMQVGWELGITPMRALQNLVVFNGRASMMEKLASALIRASGIVAMDGQIRCWFTGNEYDDDFTCHVSSRRKDEAEPNETTYSVKDAKVARLWDKKQDRGVSPWVASPKRMLMARCKQHHYQDYYSDVTMGLALTEAAIDDSPVNVASTPTGLKVRGTPTVDQPVVLQAAAPDPLFEQDDDANQVETDAELVAELDEEVIG
jgi:hypothetical protein